MKDQAQGADCATPSQQLDKRILSALRRAHHKAALTCDDYEVACAEWCAVNVDAEVSAECKRSRNWSDFCGRMDALIERYKNG